MVSLIRAAYRVALNVPEYCCLSDDDKPTTNADGTALANGSFLIEIDTGKEYIFDAENATWYDRTPAAE